MKTSQLKEAIRSIVKSKLNKVNESEESSDYVKAMDIWKRVKNHPTMSREEVETYKQKLLQAAKKAGIKLDLDESIFSPNYFTNVRPKGRWNEEINVMVYNNEEGGYDLALEVRVIDGRGMASTSRLALSDRSVPLDQFTPEYVINKVSEVYNLKDDSKKELTDFVNSVPSLIKDKEIEKGINKEN